MAGNTDDYIKLVCLNIEGDRHLPQVRKFLTAEKPDTVCLQETYLEDLKHVAEKLSYYYQFAPTVTVDHTNQKNLNPKGQRGVAILTLTKPSGFEAFYYAGEGTKIPVYNDDNMRVNKVLLYVHLLKEGKEFKVATTHLTWTPDGQSTPRQHEDLSKLFELLRPLGDCVFCGDFNAPRGRDIWERIAGKYKDNVPLNIDSTLDPILHRTNGLKKYVVDGIFSSPAYTVSNVKVIEGISDHKALVGYVSKNNDKDSR